MFRWLLFLSLLLPLTGCKDVDYYLQSVSGHLQLISMRQSIDSLLEQPSTPEELQKQLQQIAKIRDFASKELQLPENGSYRSFVKLDRPYVVWNVVATPEFSLQPLRWTFPVVGSVSYRGYFKHADAVQFADHLAQEGYDTLVVGVPAYSTLTWFDDPALSTFSDWPTPAIAELIFHELAHQKLYLPDDTTFNESYATAVEEIGIQLWLDKHATAEERQEHQARQTRQEDFQQLLLTTRTALKTLYAADLADKQMRQAKTEIFAKLKKDYQQLRDGRWQGYSGYDGWFAELNNARFASIHNYQQWVPAFRLAFQQEGEQLTRFYRRCQAIGDLPEVQRNQLLQRLSNDYLSQQAAQKEKA